LNKNKWEALIPINQKYIKKNNLDKTLKYGRTIYIPYNRIIVISGIDIDENEDIPVRDCF
jgi:hypothetical protein